MKNLRLKEMFSKLLAKLMEDRTATLKFVALLVIVLLGINYPVTMAVVVGCAIMVAIDQGAKGKDSLSFLKVPLDAVKIVAEDVKRLADKAEAKPKEDQPEASEVKLEEKK